MIDLPVQRRLVGGALRRHRERLGYTLADAASILESDPSKLSRIETGQRGIRMLDLRALLSGYGVGKEEQKTLLAIADPRRGRGWWTDYGDFLSLVVQGYMHLETIAREILTYDAQKIPELLQTPDYAQAIAELGCSHVEPQMQRILAGAQLARQHAIMSESQPQLSVIIGEAALRHLIGGDGVMREQLDWLSEIGATRSRARIQILPLSSPAHATVSSGSLEILRFAGAIELGVVRLVAAPGVEMCQVDPASAAAAAAAFTRLEDDALDPPATAQMLHDLAADRP